MLRAIHERKWLIELSLHSLPPLFGAFPPIVQARTCHGHGLGQKKQNVIADPLHGRWCLLDWSRAHGAWRAVVTQEN